MISRVLVSSFFIALALSKPLARTMRVHERREGIPNGFTLNGPASPDQVLDLRIALVQSNPQGLQEALLDVSTPSSASYGKYLSKGQAAQFVAPTTATLDAINAWVSENSLSTTTLTPAGDWIAVQVPVSKANELFDANYQVFTHETSGAQTIRTLEYSIPAELSGHLDAVHPTTSFPAPSLIQPHFKVASKRSVARAASSCADTITPSCLQSLYNIPTTPATQSSNVLGVTGYEDEWPQKSDLSSFLKQFRTDISSSTTFTLTTLDGGSDPQSSQDAGVEADLDIEYTVGLATGVPIEFISVGNNYNDDLYGWLDTINYLLSADSPPSVVTTSYGTNEDSLSSSVITNYCNAVAQLGARGVSVIFASGDGGVSGGQSQSCTTFQPVFPASCPYLTSVGATQSIPETAADFSSGGFSDVFSQPSYQSSAVAGYLNFLGDTNSGLYNASGRGFPDVAAQGVNFDIVYEGETGTVDGTSCASPTFASVIALLNDRLVAAGKPVLGFLNPWLYSTAASALNDITTGDNPGCNTNGFSATTGWDPITGLGTPNFDALLSAAGL